MAEKIVFEVDINGGNSPKTLKELNSQIETLKGHLENAEFGSKEFKNLSNDLQKAQSKVKDLEKSFEGLETAQVAESFVKLGAGITEGFAGAQAAIALMGSENQELEEIVLKSQQAISIAMAARGVTEAVVEGAVARRIIVEKASAIATAISAKAQLAYNLVVGASTGVLKLFRIALASTGVGAIIVGIGLLIANFDKLKNLISENSDKLKKAAEIILRFGNPIGLTITAIQALGKRFQFVQNIIDIVGEKFGSLINYIKDALIQLGILDSAEENAAEERLEEAEERLEALKKLKRERERQIELAKAEGKSAEEIRDLEISAIKERLEAYQNFVDSKIALGEELTDEENEQLKDLQHELKLAQLEDERLTKEENEKRIKEEKDKQKKLAEERKRAADERKRKKEEELKAIVELEKQLQDERIKAIQDERQREIEQINIEFQRRIETIKGNSELEISLRKQIEENKNKAINDINERFRKENAEKELERLEKAFTDKQAHLEAELIQLEIDNQSTYEKQRKLENLNFNQQLFTKQLSQAELERLEAEHKQRLLDIDKAEEEERLKIQQQISDAKISIAQNSINGLSAIGDLFIKNEQKREAFQKKVAIAQLAVDTAKSISSTIAGATAAAAAGGPAAPFLLAGYITSGLATVLGAFVQAKKILGDSKQTQAPQLGSGLGSSGNIAEAPRIQGTNQPNTFIRGEQSNQTQNIEVKAVVVETEMTSTQKRVKKIEDSAEF